MSKKYFVDILRDIKEDNNTKEEFDFFVKSIKILLNKSKKVSDYNIIRNMDFNNLSDRDIKEIRYFLEDWELVGRDRDKIIYLNFAKSKNHKCYCDFCNKERNAEDLFKVSSIRFPKRQVSLRLCDECIDKLQPAGRLINEEVHYTEVIDFINNCKKKIKTLKKDPYYKFTSICMNNNFKLIQDNSDLVKDFKKISLTVSTMLFNILYAKSENENMDNDYILSLKDLTRNNYIWAHERNLEGIFIFIPEVSQFITGDMPYMGKYKVALNFIQANDNYYEAMKNFYSISNCFSYNKDYFITCKVGIGNWILSHRVEDPELGIKVPTKESLLALILTIGDNNANIEKIKFTPDIAKGAKLKNYFRDCLYEVYEGFKDKEEYDEFDLFIIRMIHIVHELEIISVDDYIKLNPNSLNNTRRKTNKHKKRSSYM